MAGTVTGDEDPASPATALVLDAATGRIRAIVRDLPVQTVAADRLSFAFARYVYALQPRDPGHRGLAKVTATAQWLPSALVKCRGSPARCGQRPGGGIE